VEPRDSYDGYATQIANAQRLLDRLRREQETPQQQVAIDLLSEAIADAIRTLARMRRASEP
jgi:chaperonin GroEL (HSP60 family)